MWAQDKVQAVADKDGGSGVDWSSVDMGDEEPRRRMCTWRTWILLELRWQWLAGGCGGPTAKLIQLKYTKDHHCDHALK